jgi:hypothetical protein
MHTKYQLKIQIVKTTDPKEMDCVNVDWIHMTQEKVSWQAIMKMVMNLWVP